MHVAVDRPVTRTTAQGNVPIGGRLQVRLEADRSGIGTVQFPVHD